MSIESNRAISRILGPIVPGDMVKLGSTNDLHEELHVLHWSTEQAHSWIIDGPYEHACVGDLALVLAVSGSSTYVITCGSGKMGWTRTELLERTTWREQR